MITSIDLKNWKTHKHTRLEFTRGTNVLVGLMGAGKSSIMDAISYALFGTFPSIQHRRVTVSDLVMSRPNQESDGSVKLTLTLDNHEYSVLRTISTREPAKATLEKDGAYLQSQPQRVSEEIARILKVDYDLFSRAIYSEQNRLDYFLELRASERKNQIDELLGLDKFAIAQENATGLLNRIRETISEHEKIISNFDSAKLGHELASLEKEIGELNAKRSSLESEHVKITADAKQIEAILKSGKEALLKRTALAKEIAEIKSKLEFIKSESSKLEKEGLPEKAELERLLKETNAKLSEVKASEAASRENERRASKELSDCEAQIKQSKQKIIERDKISAELKDKDLEEEQKRVAASSESLHEIEKRLAGYQSQKEETKKWVAELERHISTCPVCDRELDPEMKAKLLEAKKGVFAAAESGILSSEKEIIEKKRSLDLLKSELDKLRLSHSRLKDYIGLDKQLLDAEQKLKGSREEYEKAKSQSEALKKSYETLTVSLAAATSNKEKAERHETYKRQAKELEEKVQKKGEELLTISVDESAVEAMQKSFVEASSRQIKIATEMVAHIRYIADKQKLIDEKSEQVKRINRILGEIGQKKEAVDNLAKFKNALEETQKAMRIRLVGAINNVMQGIWPELYPYSDYGAIMLEASATDYVLKVRTSRGEKEKWEIVEGIASGGERSIACLAMRVAFALVLVPNLKWIILDEPTHNIDEQGMGRFIRVFNETLPKIIDQIFIITHDDQLKHAASAKTYLLTRNKAEGGATLVEEN
ncbi:MAG: AAA family ATPase [Candidatus Micrarchaeota archaeon]|nr:AAA family ATPase [Candidatus Micrarchaeota archaeon]